MAINLPFLYEEICSIFEEQISKPENYYGYGLGSGLADGSGRGCGGTYTDINGNGHGAGFGSRLDKMGIGDGFGAGY
jgi:hypothetical protein